MTANAVQKPTTRHPLPNKATVEGAPSKADGNQVTSQVSSRSVKRWWEQICGTKAPTADHCRFLTESSVSWTKERDKLVFLPADVDPALSFIASSYTEAQQNEILLAVLDRISSHTKDDQSLQQPLVHFARKHVHVSGLDEHHLIHLWSQPPIFNKKPMKVVLKSLWYPQPFVCHFNEGPAMKKAAFIEAFKAQYSKNLVKSDKETGLVTAYARFYQIDNVPGEPIFAGQLLMFSNAMDFTKINKPFFMKEAEQPKDLFSFTNWKPVSSDNRST